MASEYEEIYEDYYSGNRPKTKFYCDGNLKIAVLVGSGGTHIWLGGKIIMGIYNNKVYWVTSELGEFPSVKKTLDIP